ncbi:MAG TPA: tRNA (adenosine(37)-N6)-dimethylallyltransferase MiaA [Clostridiales bacterium]|nr:tRNA (adenosine(37)-N6)-dimethylallyltransferase MiaA [Clostridiales bacterium]
MSEKIPVLAVVGPTASGKTALGVEFAKLYNGEIISADSMQIYKGMDIATAKPSVEEMQGVPHHLIGLLDRNTSFSVANYVDIAKEKINHIKNCNKLPIVVGGTGLYISSLLENIQFSEIKSDLDLRARLVAEAEEFGNEALLERLKKIDIETANTLHANNLIRIVRAIEVYELTGRKLSELKVESRRIASPYDYKMIGLTFSDRDILYNRINKRVDIMVENGLVEECEAVYKAESNENNDNTLLTSNQAIGYKELIPYFKGDSNLAECLEKIKLETRHYAKRQLTWFRRNEKINWIMLDKFDTLEKILYECKKVIAK